MSRVWSMESGVIKLFIIDVKNRVVVVDVVAVLGWIETVISENLI